MKDKKKEEIQDLEKDILRKRSEVKMHEAKGHRLRDQGHRQGWEEWRSKGRQLTTEFNRLKEKVGRLKAGKAPRVSPVANRQPKVTGRKVQIPSREIPPQRFKAVVTQALKLIKNLNRRGGSSGGKLKQKIFSFSSKGQKFVLRTLTGSRGLVSASATLQTRNGSKSFASKRRAL